MGAEQIRQQQLLLQQQQMLYQQQNGGHYAQSQQNQVPQLSKQEKLEIQGQKTSHKLNQQMNKIDDMIAKKTHQAELKQARIKELIVQGKKAQAKQMVGDLKQLKTNIENFETRRKVLGTQVNSIQMATVDASMAHTMGRANQYMKANEAVNEKINDILLDQRDVQAQMAETNHLMAEMAQGEIQQDQDDLFKQLQMQVARQKAAIITQQIQRQQPLPQVSVVQPSLIQHTQQSKQVYSPMSNYGVQHQVQYNQYRPQTTNHMDQITRMLNG